MLLVVGAVSRLVFAVWTSQWLRTVVHLSGVAGHLMLIGCQITATLTLEGALAWRGRRKGHGGKASGHRSVLSVNLSSLPQKVMIEKKHSSNQNKHRGAREASCSKGEGSWTQQDKK